MGTGVGLDKQSGDCVMERHIAVLKDTKIYLPSEVWVSLYTELAERRLLAFSFAEYSQDGETGILDESEERYSDWAQEEFNGEGDIIESILNSHGLYRWEEQD